MAVYVSVESNRKVGGSMPIPLSHAERIVLGEKDSKT